MVKTTTTAAITKYLNLLGKAQYEAYDQIDGAPEERKRNHNQHSTRRI